MSWSDEQKRRLALEFRLLKAQGFDHFAFNRAGERGKTTLEGWYTSSRDNRYRLVLRPTEHYPEELPDLYVTDPSPLLDFSGRTLVSHKSSHQMHTWESEWGEYTRICHWRGDYWSADYTMVAVLMKGMLWIEAYEVHLRTGQTINELSLSYA